MNIDDTERELLTEEIGLFQQRLRDPDARARYASLLAAVEAGAVPDSEVAALEDLLELGLESGHVRGRYLAEGEQALLRLFQRTPRGGALQETVREANRAMETLAGRVLHGVSFGARRPGCFTLALDTDRGRFTLAIERGGVRLENVEIEV
jgi:hypothetical protein